MVFKGSEACHVSQEYQFRSAFALLADEVSISNSNGRAKVSSFIETLWNACLRALAWSVFDRCAGVAHQLRNHLRGTFFWHRPTTGKTPEKYSWHWLTPSHIVQHDPLPGLIFAWSTTRYYSLRWFYLKSYTCPLVCVCDPFPVGLVSIFYFFFIVEWIRWDHLSIKIFDDDVSVHFQERERKNNKRSEERFKMTANK